MGFVLVGICVWGADTRLKFRSCVAAFYPHSSVLSTASLAPFAEPIPQLRLLLRIRSEVEKIVHRMPEILFAAETAFRGLHRGISQQELDLLQFTTAILAQLRTSSPQIMRGDVLQTGFQAAGSDQVPDNVL